MLEERHMNDGLEPIAAQYGLDLRRLHRILLPAEVRARLEHLERRAAVARAEYREVQEALADRQMEHSRFVRADEERRRDLRPRDREEAVAAAQLVALLAAEVDRAKVALEAAAARAQDAGRLATNLREHLLGRTAPYGVAREPASTSDAGFAREGAI